MFAIVYFAMETFYTPEEVADQLKIHLQTVLRYIRDGKLKAVKLDKGYRVSDSDFQAFIHGSRVAKTPEDYLLKLGIQKKYKGFRKTFMKPVKELTKLIPNYELDKLLEDASVRDHQGYRAFPLPGLSIMSEKQSREFDGLLLQKEIEFAGDLFFFAFASTKGELLTAESLWEDTESSQFKNSIGLLTSIGVMLRGLLFIPRYYSKIEGVQEVNYQFIIDKPFGRNLAMDTNRPVIWTGEYTATTEDPIIIERKISISITQEEAKNLLFEMVKEFLWYFKCEIGDDIIKSRIEEIYKNVIG